MKRSLILAAAVLATVVAPLAANAQENTVQTRLVGYQETPQTINSPGSGEFRAKISHDGSTIDYELTYRDLSSSVLQSHIHFGRPATSGGIVLFLCTNLTPPAGVPAPPACPTPGGTVTGTLTAANVIALPTVCSPACSGQAIDSGAAGLAEILKAIRAGATYVNVHTTNHPSGEIRGRLRDRGEGERNEHHDHH
jgi:hypothetical protein